MRLDGFTDLTEILRCGVYALGYRGSVVYVGKAKCGLSRIATHRANRAKRLPTWAPASLRGVLFDEIHFLPCHPDTVDETERQMIARYRPRLNIRSKPTGPLTEPVTFAYGNNVITLGAPESAAPLRRRAFA